MRLAAGLRPDPLEELERSPQTFYSRNRVGGPTSKVKGDGEGKEQGTRRAWKRKGRERKGDRKERIGGENGGGRGMGLPPLYLTFACGPEGETQRTELVTVLKLERCCWRADQQ